MALFTSKRKVNGFSRERSFWCKKGYNSYTTVSHFLFHVGPEPRRPARGTSDDPVMVFDDDEGKRVDHPIEVG